MQYSKSLEKVPRGGRCTRNQVGRIDEAGEAGGRPGQLGNGSGMFQCVTPAKIPMAGGGGAEEMGVKSFLLPVKSA